MTTNELIAMIVQAVLVPLIIWGIVEAKRYLTAKIKNVEVERILEQATDAAQKCAAEVGQTYVDNIKGTDKWTAENQQKALGLAMAKARAMLTQEGINLLQETTGSVNGYLQAAIEEAVREQKK